MTVFMNILTVSGFMVGVLCFFGYDQKFRGWNRQRNISRLEKQRKYYVELAGSEAARNRLIYPNLFILMGLLFAYLMFLGVAGSRADSVMRQLLQFAIGTTGYMFACLTLGRLNRVRVIDTYLARVDKALEKLHT